MAKRKFQSRYSDKQVTPAQYLAEFVCENRARSMKKELPRFFWKIKEWEKYYKYQIFLAYPLLRQYNIDEVVKVLRGDGAHIWSLRNPHLITLIKQELDKAKHDEKLRQSKEAPLPKPSTETKTFRRKQGKSLLDSLKELDG